MKQLPKLPQYRARYMAEAGAKFDAARYSRAKASAIDTGRRGEAPGFGAGQAIKAKAKDMRLPAPLLNQCYIRSPYIRTCIDTIRRTMSGLSWDVVGDLGEKLNPVQRRTRQDLVDFFRDPNWNKGSWPQFVSSCIGDCLKYDSVAIEKVRGMGTGKLTELVPRNGPDFEIIQDRTGMLQHYVQRTTEGREIKFLPEELIYYCMYPSNDTPYGLSPIQSIIEQITFLLLTIDHNNRYYSRDEIPDGIVFLTGIDKKAWDKIKAEARAEKGHHDKLLSLVTPKNDAKMQWERFTRSNRDEEAVPLEERAERIINRVFGLDMTTAGTEQKYGTRSRAQVEKAATRSGLIEPLAQTLAGYLNNEVVMDWPGAEGLRLIIKVPQDLDREVEAKYHDTNIRAGRRTVNQSLLDQGLPPYENAPWADRPMMEVGGSLFLLDEGIFISPAGKTDMQAPPDLGKARSSVLMQAAKRKGHAMAEQIEDKIRQYHQELKTIYENFGLALHEILARGMVERQPFAMTRTERDIKVEDMRKARDRAVLQAQQALQKYVPQAAEIGTERAAQRIGHHALDPATKTDIINQLVQKEKGFMVEAYRRYLDKYLWLVNRMTKGPGGLPDNLDVGGMIEMGEAETAILAANAASVVAFSRYLWAVENVIYGREAGAAGLKVYWHTTSGNPCDTCSELGEKIHDPMQLIAFPGEGTHCDGRCHCFLEILDPNEPGQVGG